MHGETASAQSIAADSELAAPADAPRGTIREQDEPVFRDVVRQAAQRYRPSGRGPYFFARGKLRGDPVFAALLRDGRITDGARVLDVGCGLGVLAALLAEAERCALSAWPKTWMPPPANWSLHGFDLRASAIAVGQRALHDLQDRVSLEVGDAREIKLPVSDIAVIFDVLHFLDATAQQSLLARVRTALAPTGTLLLRVADARPDWRFRYTLAIDWLVSFGRGMPWPRLHCRPLTDWHELLHAVGFDVSSQPMSDGTPFANVLLIATKK